MREHRGIAVAVAVVSVAFLATMGPVILILGWTGFSVYALVKWIGSAPDAANPAVVILLFVGIVTVLTTLLGVTIGLAGRAMTPRKRRRDPLAGEAPGL
jgi:hypothetical protein